MTAKSVLPEIWLYNALDNDVMNTNLDQNQSISIMYRYQNILHGKPWKHMVYCTCIAWGIRIITPTRQIKPYLELKIFSCTAMA